jgi:hypothetical protein
MRSGVVRTREVDAHGIPFYLVDATGHVRVMTERGFSRKTIKQVAAYLIEDIATAADISVTCDD